MVIFSQPKCGKTTAISGLPNCLIIDLEDGTDYVDGFIINVLAEAAKKLNLRKPKEVLNHPQGNDAVLSVLYEISQELAKGDIVYDFIAIDTATRLVDYATHMATLNYKSTPLGKNYNGKNVVIDLPQGGGYPLMWDAFTTLLQWFEPYANVSTIIVTHTKDSSVLRDGRDLSARDIALTGKLKDIICQNAQAIGYMRRADGSKTIISFKNDERDRATGARTSYLANQEFVLVEEVPAGSRNFVFHWDKIFPSVKK